MRVALLVVCVIVAACARSDRPKAGTADTLTRRQRDSILGASRLPGAHGIQGALRAQDSAAAQNARADSIQ